MTERDRQRLDQFTSLVLEHQAPLRAFVRSLGAGADWVDDLAQEVFIVAYRKLEDIIPGREFAKFLRGVARNLVANETRKSRLRSRLLNEALSRGLLERCEGREEPSDTRETVDAMHECLAELPDPARRMLHQRYAEEATSSTIAQVLNRTPASIRQALMRIRELVRKCLAGKLGEGWA